jgi:hypothetical protein
MSLQPLFRRFHESIQLKNYDESAELRQKRDDILERLREKLRPRTFTWFNQGSYAMGTGTKPVDSDYDIDIGLVFDVNHGTTDPVTVKQWVHQAILGHTARVEWQNPCITVHYQHAGTPKYHVDLAVMVRDANGTLRLAWGKEHAPAEQRKWQVDDRQGFIEAFKKRFSGEEAGQLCRVIRYLKRWKGEHFPKDKHVAPTGLSLTVAAYRWFRPMTVRTPQGGIEYDDLAATSALVGALRQGFTQVFDARRGRNALRLSLPFPLAPHDDVFERMESQKMEEFHGRLEKLSGWLEEARKTQDAAPLRRAFGSQFPLT